MIRNTKVFLSVIEKAFQKKTPVKYSENKV